jgi:hypothetical protein
MVGTTSIISAANPRMETLISNHGMGQVAHTDTTMVDGFLPMMVFKL